MQRKNYENEMLREKIITPKRKQKRNKEYTLVSVFFVLIFMSLIGYLIYFNIEKSEEFINSPYNTRQDTFSDRVIRGKIMSSDGQVLAETEVYDDGTEHRYYPYYNVFSHVIGYDSNGKSGLESEANFQLLTSHSFFIDQMRNEFSGKKNMGDTVISTLDASLQSKAYYALGDRRGAIVALEPSTGKIRAMVSKPDFDPNTIAEQYQYLISDSNSSNLLNRATNGAYPPGSTFKVVTALDYYRTNGTMDGYQYLCNGSITEGTHTINCYNNTVHGAENLYQSFAYSCNCAFADMALRLGGKSLNNTAQSLLFNRELPLETYRSSTFGLSDSSPRPLIMQTSIGQGNTLVSPMHMALITSAIANKGVLMKPTLIDSVQNDAGEVISTQRPEAYKRLLSAEEASVLGEMMEGVVSYGTATSLSGLGYTVAGKTGSAEYDEEGHSHSWFIGYCNTDNPDLVVAIIVEGGGTGSEAAVPIAQEIFDEFYY